MRYRISASHYVPEKIACKHFSGQKRNIKNKQTNKCRGGNHNLSSAVFSGCRLISYSHPSKESGISCHMQTCFATSFDLPELQDFRQKTKAEEANSHRAVTRCVSPTVITLSGDRSWKRSSPRELVQVRAAQPRGHGFHGAHRSLV